MSSPHHPGPQWCQSQAPPGDNGESNPWKFEGYPESRFESFTYYTIQINIEWYILSISSNDKTWSESTTGKCLGPPSPTMPRLHHGLEDTVFFQGWLNVNLTWAFVSCISYCSRVDTPLIHHFNRVYLLTSHGVVNSCIPKNQQTSSTAVSRNLSKHESINPISKNAAF